MMDEVAPIPSAETSLRQLHAEGRLTTRQLRALEADGLRTLEDVARLTPHRKRTIPNVGPLTLATLDGLISGRLAGRALRS